MFLNLLRMHSRKDTYNLEQLFIWVFFLFLILVIELFNANPHLNQ